MTRSEYLDLKIDLTVTQILVAAVAMELSDSWAWKLVAGLFTAVVIAQIISKYLAEKHAKEATNDRVQPSRRGRPHRVGVDRPAP